ncbi:hypothetical protein J6590_033584 [Homalodisca vitripennis]|nr:hypothetical protein J6590_033584 [Homalodisca vitripennis]
MIVSSRSDSLSFLQRREFLKDLTLGLFCVVSASSYFPGRARENSGQLFANCVTLGFAYWDAPILAIGQSLSLHALSTRRSVHDVLFLFKLLNNLVDAPELLALISFRCPTAQTRSRELFVRKHVDTNYRANFFSNRVHHLGNFVCQHLDYFACSYSFFRNSLFTMLNDA